MSLPRSIEAEWLDTLAPDDPGAVGSRRDLRVLNAFMLHGRIMAGLLKRHAPSPPRSILELGCGDGTFMLQVARRLAPLWPEVTLTLLDRQNLVTPQTREAYAALGWTVLAVSADVFEYLESPRFGGADVVTANLFLHHFAPDALTRMLAQFTRSARLVVACEPRRNLTALAGSRLVWVLGCNRVTRHDAPASVRAGFNGSELTNLWPVADRWQLTEYAMGPLTHCFAARRAGRP